MRQAGVYMEGNMMPACRGAGAQSPWLDACRSQELCPTNRRPTCRATVSYRARLLATVPYQARFSWAPCAWMCLLYPGVRAVRRSASTPPVLVSCTTSLSPRGTLFPAACAESITGLLSANTHALASALYYPHTSQLRSTRYILPHAVRHLPCPNSPRARALLKYRSYNFLLEDPAKPNLFSS